MAIRFFPITTDRLYPIKLPNCLYKILNLKDIFTCIAAPRNCENALVTLIAAETSCPRPGVCSEVTALGGSRGIYS